jgi:hypothetical protein
VENRFHSSPVLARLQVSYKKTARPSSIPPTRLIAFLGTPKPSDITRPRFYHPVALSIKFASITSALFNGGGRATYGHQNHPSDILRCSRHMVIWTRWSSNHSTFTVSISHSAEPNRGRHSFSHVTRKGWLRCKYHGPSHLRRKC